MSKTRVSWIMCLWMFFAALQVNAQQKKPNILVIWGDDVGYSNVSVYSHGMMGYKTPNIDSLAKDGALFSDFYGQQSCTAGRSAFILGEHPFRTGLLTVGLPGSPHGSPDWAPTIADLLKPQGYATGQFGKNHLGEGLNLNAAANINNNTLKAAQALKQLQNLTESKSVPMD